jgi:CHAD domain-containing protein
MNYSESVLNSPRPSDPQVSSSEPLSQEIYQTMARALHRTAEKLPQFIDKLIETDGAKIVHDTRVASRRLQQALAVLFPKPRPSGIRKNRRTLRRIRRILGEWRNCDVLLALTAPAADSSASAEASRAWERVRDRLQKIRSEQIRRSRRKIEKFDHTGFWAKFNKSIELQPALGFSELTERARAAEGAARQKWLSALNDAESNLSAEAVHQFRIATKRLRYRTELIQPIFDADRTETLTVLKELQELLGRWHDWQSLQRVIAHTLADPEFLLKEPLVADYLLKTLVERQRAQTTSAAEVIRLSRQKADQLAKQIAPGGVDPGSESGG